MLKYQNELMAAMQGMRPDFKLFDNYYSPQQIINVVAKSLYILPEDIVGISRERAVVDARYLAIYLIRKYSDLNLTQIGIGFNRDHSTIIYALDVAANLLDNNSQFKAKMSRVHDVMEVLI